MPARSKKQAKAAQIEYLRRTVHGYRKQRSNEKSKRPFGSATTEQIKNFIAYE